jgi:hypothetical protein
MIVTKRDGISSSVGRASLPAEPDPELRHDRLRHLGADRVWITIACARSRPRRRRRSPVERTYGGERIVPNSVDPISTIAPPAEPA